MAKKGTYKPKRSKSGRERYTYLGVSQTEFLSSMRTGTYRGKKISRRGSDIRKTGGFSSFILARRKK